MIASEDGVQAIESFQKYYSQNHFPCICILDYRMEPIIKTIIEQEEVVLQGGLISARKILDINADTSIIIFSGDIETVQINIKKWDAFLLDKIILLQKGAISFMHQLLPVIQSLHLN